MTPYSLNFDEVRHCRVTTDGRSINIGSLHFDLGDTIEFGESVGTLDSGQLLECVVRCDAVTGMTCYPQLAAHLFTITRHPRLMDLYFPITRALDQVARDEFDRLIAIITQHKPFDFRLMGGKHGNLAAQIRLDVAYLVAGHIAEVFFYRRDLLDRFFSQRRGFYLYATPQAFKGDGGVAGGCYNAQRAAIQLVLSRLYEGFYEPTPGVAPFIHEFGHMLDHASGGRGLLPGMDEFIDEFRVGKTLELERYEYARQGQKDALPIGHPYVFQNDGEFMAGYLEMFFRNPHYFAEQNPTLYDAFLNCLRQDPRQYWQQDFPYYVNQNRKYYLSGQRPPKPGITLP